MNWHYATVTALLCFVTLRASKAEYCFSRHLSIRACMCTCTHVCASVCIRTVSEKILTRNWCDLIEVIRFCWHLSLTFDRGLNLMAVHRACVLLLHTVYICFLCVRWLGSVCALYHLNVFLSSLGRLTTIRAVIFLESAGQCLLVVTDGFQIFSL